MPRYLGTESGMPFYVYVLRSLKDGGLYTGSTSDLQRRIRQHNASQTKSLKHRRPLSLVYFEEFNSRAEAMARERYFKTAEGGVLKSRLVAQAERDAAPERRADLPGVGAC